jgi:hypothetical protein
MADTGPAADVFGRRYGEVLLVLLGASGPEATVYNTFGLNDCPAELWDRLDAEANQTTTPSWRCSTVRGTGSCPRLRVVHQDGRVSTGARRRRHVVATQIERSHEGRVGQEVALECLERDVGSVTHSSKCAIKSRLVTGRSDARSIAPGVPVEPPVVRRRGAGVEDQFLQPCVLSAGDGVTVTAPEPPCLPSDSQ